MTADRAPAEALFFEGNRRMAAGDAPGAEVCFREALRLAGDLAEAHANLGLLLERTGRTGQAEHHYRQAVRLSPDAGQAQLNLGAFLAKAKRLDEAEVAYLSALEAMPGSAAAWSNFGALQACRKRDDIAERCLRKAMALDAGFASAQFNLAYLLLRQGRYEEGWACFEKRDWYHRLAQRLPCPRWQGETVAGRSILIGFEAGHGDMIQLGRYAGVLKGNGAGRVDILCHPALKTLFASLDGIDAALAFDEALPACRWDFWTPPFSLPFHYRTRLDSIPAQLPYLHADADRRRHWAAELDRRSAPGELRVGVAWKGSRGFENDADRSLPGLATLEPLWAIGGVRWFSLQKGAGADEAARPPGGMALADLGPELADFADTAAAMAGLDLIISVDTAVAHLAGALARDCWLLLPDYKTDWRWLADRSDSPWYPRVMRLFRQPRPGDWASVIGDVATALRLRVANGTAAGVIPAAD